MATFAFICNALLMIFLIISATTNFRASVKCLALTGIFGGLTAFFALIAVIIFGVTTDTYSYLDVNTGLGLDTYLEKGKWMPRPEYTFLSWSFICEVFAGIFALVSSESSLSCFSLLFSVPRRS